jgi:hypothetical protein
MSAIKPLFLSTLLVKNQNNLDLLTESIQFCNMKLEQLSSSNPLRNQINTIVFVEEHLLDATFFRDEQLFDRIENLDVFFILIGTTKKFIPQPLNIKRIFDPISGKKQIISILEMYKDFQQKLNQRDKALTKKLNRLFYIYHQLYEKESIKMTEILRLTKVSRRTIYRDFQTLREVLVTQTIKYDENEQMYYMEDIKF